MDNLQPPVTAVTGYQKPSSDFHRKLGLRGTQSEKYAHTYTTKKSINKAGKAGRGSASEIGQTWVCQSAVLED